MTDVSRFRELLDCFEATREAADVDAVRWPEGIPQPCELVDRVPSDASRLNGELAVTAVSWALLHELRHLIHQQDGTASGESETGRWEEEISCDLFATEFLLARVGEYAQRANQDESLVKG